MSTDWNAVPAHQPVRTWRDADGTEVRILRATGKGNTQCWASGPGAVDVADAVAAYARERIDGRHVRAVWQYEHGAGRHDAGKATVLHGRLRQTLALIEQALRAHGFTSALRQAVPNGPAVAVTLAPCDSGGAR